MKKEDIIGNIYTNNNGEKYLVKNELYSKGTETYYEVEFLSTHTKKKAEKRNIKNGAVRDDYSKHIYGVACKGLASSRHPVLNKVAFKRWYAMIERCYNTKAHMYSSYGGKGVYVSNEWLCFEKYLQDIQDIYGFDYDKYIAGDIQLDKDIMRNGNKLYSKETCVFINRSDNAKHQPTKKKSFVATSPDGRSYIFDSQSECARTFKLVARSIGKVLNEDMKTHHGWTFKYV